MRTSNFWRGRRVFLSGHTGFKGAWLALWLKHLGARTTGFALPPPTTPSLYELAAVDGCVDSIIGDISDAAALLEAVRSSQPDVVFHLAAQALVTESYAQPAATFATNVMGTVNLLEAVRHVPSIRSVVVVATDKCYGDNHGVRGYRETDPLGGHDPYSASKAAAELVSSSYRSSFFTSGVSVATARAGNVIGGGDFAKDRLLPDFIGAVRCSTGLEIRHPDAVRPWQFVLEPLRGYLELAERGYFGEKGIAEAWNFGPNEASAWTVREVVQAFSEVSAPYRPSQIEFGASSQHHETALLRLDTSKARTRLRWRPLLDLNAALAWTAEWYRAYFEGADLRALSERQLENYLNDIGGCSAISAGGIA